MIMKLFVILSFLLLNSLYSGVLTDSDKPQFPTTNLIKNSGFENSDISWTSSNSEQDDTAFYTNLGTGFNSGIYTLIYQFNGTILIGGAFTTFKGNTRNRLVRLNSDGTEDTAFYTNLGTGFNSGIYTLIYQFNGTILIGGAFSTLNGNTRNRLVKLNFDGTDDTDFYANLGTGFNSEIYTLATQSDGKILVGGAFTTFNGNARISLIRLNSDGTEDTTFYANLGMGFNNVETVFNVIIQSNGKILVGGAFTAFNGDTRNKLIRLNSDGTEDIAFYANLGTGFNNTVYNISEQSDEKILVDGAFTTFNGNTRNRLIRLNSDGTENAAFYTNLGTGFNSDIRILTPQSDGKILVGGAFTTLNGNTRNKLIRLNFDGTEDTNFYINIGTGFNSATDAIAIQSDGKILTGGLFTTLNGITRNRLLRLTFTKSFNISSNMAEGLYSASFDANFANNYFEQTNIYVPYGLRNNQCVFGFYYKGGDANLTAEILDSSNSVISSKVLSTQADWALINQAFTCPNETVGLKFKIIATANAAIAYFDNTYIFDNTKGNQKTDLNYIRGGSTGEYEFPLIEGTVTNCQLTLTTTGRPIFIGLIPDGGTNPSELLYGFFDGNLYITRDGTAAGNRIARFYYSIASNVQLGAPVSSINFIDISASAGSHTYYLRAKSVTNSNIYINYARLFIYEL